MGEDVFECRVEFAHLIAPLALSKKTLSQASMYAISHYSIHQDLTDVIISELKEVSSIPSYCSPDPCPRMLLKIIIFYWSQYWCLLSLMGGLGIGT